VLCESLTYSQGPPEVLEGTPLAAGRPNCSVYRPPFDEFEVARVAIPANAHATPVGMQESLPKSPVRALLPVLAPHPSMQKSPLLTFHTPCARPAEVCLRLCFRS
jgi:hypothetical protein